MGDDLTNKTIDALSWSFLESVVSRGIRFAVGIVLARLLFPEQFGLIGMLLIFIAIASVFVRGGFGLALIQKVEVTKADICSIFYFNIAVGLLATVLLCLIAPWIADFFEQPTLTALLRFISLAILIDSLGGIQETLFSKDINFKAQTLTSLIAGLLSGAVGISMAAEGFGVWSLAAQQVSNSAFRTLCLWLLSSWRPALIFRFESLREMFGFGSRVFFSGLLEQVFQNIYFPVIGKLFSAVDLGLFTRASSLQSLPSQTLSNVVGRVTFPVFAQSQNDPARLKRGLKKALAATVLLNFPVMVGIAVTARPLVIVLLGQKWSGCIYYLQLLCVSGLLYPLQLMNLNILTSMGRSDLFFRLEVIKKILIVINVAVSWRWGVDGIVYGMILISFISFYLNSYYTRFLIDYSGLEQSIDLLPYLAVALVMGLVAFSVGLLGFSSYLFMLIAQVLSGVVFYIAACWALRLPAFVQVRREVCERIPFLRNGLTG